MSEFGDQTSSVQHEQLQRRGKSDWISSRPLARDFGLRSQIPWVYESTKVSLVDGPRLSTIHNEGPLLRSHTVIFTSEFHSRSWLMPRAGSGNGGNAPCRDLKLAAWPFLCKTAGRSTASVATWPSWKISMPPSLLSWAIIVREPGMEGPPKSPHQLQTPFISGIPSWKWPNSLESSNRDVQFSKPFHHVSYVSMHELHCNQYSYWMIGKFSWKSDLSLSQGAPICVIWAPQQLCCGWCSTRTPHVLNIKACSIRHGFVIDSDVPCLSAVGK